MSKHSYPKQYKHKMPAPEELSWWYLSFVDSHKGWLGACCVEADSIQDAVDTAYKAGCNPGGEVLGLALKPADPVPQILQYKLVADEAMIELLLGDIMQLPAGQGTCVECEKDQHTR
ncbi:MAG: hypothetical protein WAK55_17500 [Xanthobacteraceae bacterium]